MYDGCRICFHRPRPGGLGGPPSHVRRGLGVSLYLGASNRMKRPCVRVLLSFKIYYAKSKVSTVNLRFINTGYIKCHRVALTVASFKDLLRVSLAIFTYCMYYYCVTNLRVVDNIKSCI